VDQEPIAHSDDEGIDSGTGVEHPIQVVQSALLRLAHDLEVLALYHHALGDYPGGQPGLHRAEEQSPVGQVDPPLGIVVLEVLVRAPDVQQGADQGRQAGDGRYPAVEQVNDPHLRVALPLREKRLLEQIELEFPRNIWFRGITR